VNIILTNAVSKHTCNAFFRLYFGGVPPDFNHAAFPDLGGTGAVGSLLGSMRAITTSNPGSNSLLNPLYTEQAGI
jgi:hypothetical protein